MCNVEIAPVKAEMRKHRRLDIRLPLEYAPATQGAVGTHSTATVNVSTGGVYFETDHPDLGAGDLLNLHLTIPPGGGHFPYQGRISSLGVVVRVNHLSDNPRRWGVAAQFRESLKLDF
jgi:hypothetical protein